MSRFSDPQDPAFQALNASLSFDRRLWPQDWRSRARTPRCSPTRGSSAPRTATRCTPASTRSSASSGRQLPVPRRRRGHPHGDRAPPDGDRRPVGGKLHTARSRNDQVATDVAMYVREHARTARTGVRALQAVLLDLAERHARLADARLHAPPARAARLPRPPPARLLLDARARRRPLRLRRGRGQPPAAGRRRAQPGQLRHRPRPVARALGFDAVVENSIDAVSNRDFVLDYLSAAATCATHLSRLGAEIVLWSSEEFGFCEVSPTRSPRAPRSCPRRRTLTPPSCCARRRRGSPPTSSGSTASCTASR